MVVRSRSGTLRIRKALKSEEHATCVFCNINKQPESIVQETKNFYIIKNKYPYTFWDSQNVEDHLMIFPKKHTDTISNLQSHEAVEYIDVVGSYEAKGYNVYSRSPQSKLKSVIHQHTHLIKPGAKTAKVLLYSRKPYIRIVK